LIVWDALDIHVTDRGFPSDQVFSMSYSPERRSTALRFFFRDGRSWVLSLSAVLGFGLACGSEPGDPDGNGSGGGAPDGAGGAAGGNPPVESSGGTDGVSTGGAATSTGGSSGDGGAGTGGEGWEGPWPPAETFQNPILWQDIADPEVLRVGDVFYYTGSNMHHSPGAPILRSYDLVNWEFAGHAIPSLDFGPNYRLEGGQRAYIGGDWASTLKFRESDQQFYFLACIRTGQT
jgi:hypothetical protein